VITIPERHTQTDRQTDRQTDGQTTYDSNTALCTKVHRAVISTVSVAVYFSVFLMPTETLLLLRTIYTYPV